MKIGLKLWSVNENYVYEAQRLYEEKVYDYIELYVVPGSYEKFIGLWKGLAAPFIIHAPHFQHGVNPARKELHKESFEKADEALHFADTLNAEYIIFHPGINGDKENTVDFFKKLNDHRMLVENKPYYALDDGLVCNGNSPEEIQFILENTGVGFCLDAGHAVCSASTRKIDYLDYIDRFLTLNPVMYHLTDKDVDQELDQHLHFGQGSMDLKQIVKRFGPDPEITIETEKDSNNDLLDFEKDAGFLRNLGNE